MRMQLGCCCRRALDAKQERQELQKSYKELFYTYLRDAMISYIRRGLVLNAERLQRKFLKQD